jgi:succinate dehydrogenase / fumarate reductase, membrane anchor subunit
MARNPNRMASGDTHIEVMRSQLGRVRGLGAAKSGVGHWWGERVTSLALVPLTLWFIAAAIRLLGAPHEAVLDWMASPVTIVLMLCLVLTTFHHMHLGLQVVIEDYVHVESTRFLLLLGVRALTAILALLCIVSVLRLGL